MCWSRILPCRRVTGWDLIPRLRAARPDLPVVVMTGYLLPPGGAERLSADQRGPLALLHKPFGIHQLVAALRRVAAPADWALLPAA